MNNKYFRTTLSVVLLVFLNGFFLMTFSQEVSKSPLRQTLQFDNTEREYYIHNLQEYDSEQKNWLLVVVHGGGGNGKSYFMIPEILNSLRDSKLQALVVAPSFSNTDVPASRFPSLGEGEFLKKVIEDLRKEFDLHEKILLTGYSRGGQFTHRFAMYNPDLVLACAPFAAGTWTTPDGKLLIQDIGEVNDPVQFLSDTTNSGKAAERLKNLFNARVANVAGKPAKKGAERIPFMVMCGTLDPRIDIAKQYAESLRRHGYAVTTEWPRNPHGDKSRHPEEFKKYAQNAVKLFTQSTR